MEGLEKVQGRVPKDKRSTRRFFLANLLLTFKRYSFLPQVNTVCTLPFVIILTDICMVGSPFLIKKFHIRCHS